MAAEAVDPPFLRWSADCSSRTRWVGAATASACAAILAVARVISPAPSGMGTHRQLGLPPCGFHMATGIPCPTCGMTTAVSNVAHLHLLAALRAQPAGALLGLLVASGVPLGLWMAVSGRRPVVDWVRVTPDRLALTIAAILVGSWVVKVILAH